VRVEVHSPIAGRRERVIYQCGRNIKRERGKIKKSIGGSVVG
jgi:hypothetical protein